jgi:hypothetical protein
MATKLPVILAGVLAVFCALAALYCYSSELAGLRIAGLGLMVLAGLAMGFGSIYHRKTHSLPPNLRPICWWLLGFGALGLLGLLLPRESPARVLRFLAVLLTKILRHL